VLALRLRFQLIYVYVLFQPQQDFSKFDSIHLTLITFTFSLRLDHLHRLHLLIPSLG
jgi:hypothetical protein